MFKAFYFNNNFDHLLMGSAIHEAIALPVGDLSYIEAVALPENFFTVWANVFQIGQLKKNETVLVHGGTSGIGSVIAIAINKWTKLLLMDGNMQMA